MIIETQTVTKLTPSEGMHLKRIATGEMYPEYIYPAQGLTASDFTEVTEAEYQAWFAEQNPPDEEVTEGGGEA